MTYPAVIEKLKVCTMNRNGFTFLMAIFMVMIIGILSAFTGKTWTMVMKREREKELLFRGSQIKEAIENWYEPKYSVQGVKWTGPPRPLMDLKDLLENPYVPTLRYLPQSYAAEIDGENYRCAPDCAKLKVYQDPITGKEWTVIRGNYTAGKSATVNSATQGVGIIGIASKSDDAPLKTDFKDTALENMGSAAIGSTTGTIIDSGSFPHAVSVSVTSGMDSTPPALGGKMTKYSEWKFIADPKNDHTKIYRAYHEGW